MTLRALSVRQPWAMAICHGKDVENRSRRTHFRGTIALHASKAFDHDNVGPATLRRVMNLIGLTEDLILREDHRGAVIAVVDIVGCHRDCVSTNHRHCSPWAVWDEWHWELANVRALAEPVPCKGALGLWRLPVDVDEAVRAQLAERAA